MGGRVKKLKGAFLSLSSSLFGGGDERMKASTIVNVTDFPHCPCLPLFFLRHFPSLPLSTTPPPPPRPSPPSKQVVFPPLPPMPSALPAAAVSTKASTRTALPSLAAEGLEDVEASTAEEGEGLRRGVGLRGGVGGWEAVRFFDLFFSGLRDLLPLESETDLLLLSRRLPLVNNYLSSHPSTPFNRLLSTSFLPARLSPSSPSLQASNRDSPARPVEVDLRLATVRLLEVGSKAVRYFPFSLLLLFLSRIEIRRY